MLIWLEAEDSSKLVMESIIRLGKVEVERKIGRLLFCYSNWGKLSPILNLQLHQLNAFVYDQLRPRLYYPLSKSNRHVFAESFSQLGFK